MTDDFDNDQNELSVGYKKNPVTGLFHSMIVFEGLQKVHPHGYATADEAVKFGETFVEETLRSMGQPIKKSYLA